MKISEILIGLEKQYEVLKGRSKESLLNHLISLLDLHCDKKRNYPKVDARKIKFPDEVHIAYAVCDKNCGAREFIVDGSTQECQYCGGLMYRVKTKKFIIN